MYRHAVFTLSIVVSLSCSSATRKAPTVDPASPTAAVQRAEFIATGSAASCATNPEGSAQCWGAAMPAVSPSGKMSQLELGDFHACAITDAGEITCWGKDAADPAALDAPTGTFAQLAASPGSGCAIDTTGVTQCWGRLASPKDSYYRQISIDTRFGCGVTQKDHVSCWGSEREGRTEAPTGLFKSVSVANTHACGITSESELSCWGAPMEDGRERALPPTGTFRSVSLGHDVGCAVRKDGALACWGNSEYDMTQPPPGKFQSVSVGGDHACGIRDTGEVVCWGANGDGQASPWGTGRPFSPDRPSQTQCPERAAEFAHWLQRLQGEGSVLYPTPLQLPRVTVGSVSKTKLHVGRAETLLVAALSAESELDLAHEIENALGTHDSALGIDRPPTPKTVVLLIEQDTPWRRVSEAAREVRGAGLELAIVLGVESSVSAPPPNEEAFELSMRSHGMYDATWHKMWGGCESVFDLRASCIEGDTFAVGKWVNGLEKAIVECACKVDFELIRAVHWMAAERHFGQPPQVHVRFPEGELPDIPPETPWSEAFSRLRAR